MFFTYEESSPNPENLTSTGGATGVGHDRIKDRIDLGRFLDSLFDGQVASACAIEISDFVSRQTTLKKVQ
jgi:hypothetical protein